MGATTFSLLIPPVPFPSYHPVRHPAALRQSAEQSSVYDITFLVNLPRSITNTDMDKLAAFIKNFVAQNFLIGPSRTRVALVTFAQDTSVAFTLDTYRDLGSLQRGIDVGMRRHAADITNVTAALERVRRDVYRVVLGDRPHVPNIVYLLLWRTSPSMSMSALQREATLAKLDKVAVFGVALSSAVDRHQLYAASWSRSFVLMVPSIESLTVGQLWQQSRLLSGGECALPT